MADNTFLAPLSPIQRSTPAQNLIAFQKNEYNLYNKFSPYYQAGGDIGSDQPYIYTKLTDSSAKKNLTKYDTQALPGGSLVRDVQRMTKFTASGRGLLFTGKQILIQGQAAFDETRTYNAGSVIGSSGGSTIGSIIGALFSTERSSGVTRHIEGQGGLLNFFAGSLLSTIGMQTNRLTNSTTPIPGTATGPSGGPNALSKHAQISGGGRYGLMRGETASGGRANFDKVWVGAGRPSGNGGFLQSIMRAVASTTGLFSNSGRPADWEYRPEYGKRSQDDNAYTKMYLDVRKKLSFKGKRGLYQIDGVFSFGNFYNDITSERDTRDPEILVQDVMHTNAPVFLNSDGSGIDPSYASKRRVTDRYNKIEKSGLDALYKRMLDIDLAQNEDQHPMYNKSTERYSIKNSAKVDEKNNYKTIPSEGRTSIPYYTYFSQKGLTLDKKGFGKISDDGKTIYSDEYNTLTPYDSQYGLKQKKGNLPYNITGYEDNQSKDLVFFYFYDLINEMYIPFRATLGSIQDNNTADWEDIKYMGRADKLFVYKGFSRDVSFNFRVYANSINELIPNWERVNYLVGLTRPSKYTARAIATTGPNAGLETDSTGRESGFIYPPMIEFRIGDLYVDQPAILRSAGVTVPDDAHWETLRANNYTYNYGASDEKVITRTNAKSRQLPTIIDVSIQLSVIEKEQSQTKNYHFGPQVGWSTL
jgi:hypothetical protein